MKNLFFKRFFSGTRKYALILSSLFLLQNLFGQSEQDVFSALNNPSLNYYDVCDKMDTYFKTHSTGKGSGYKQYQRWKNERRFHIDKEGNSIASAPSVKTNKKTTVKSVGEPNTGFNWTDLGPFGIERQSSRIRDIDFSSNGTVLYAVAEGGGIWKSTNDGTSWLVITDELSSTDLYTVAVAPSNDQILYAGGDQYGIFKSMDGGVTWSASSFANHATTLVWEIKVHPTNPSYVLAATTNGIFITTNGGGSWTQSTFARAEDIVFKPNDPNTVYAVGGGSYFRSTNGGVSFTTNSTLIAAYSRSKVAVAASNAAYVYILTANGDQFGALKRSTDSGVNFSDRSVGNPSAGTNYFCPDYNGGCGQAWHNMAFAISPTNSEEIMIGANMCSRSTNGGISFALTADHHWDVHAVAFKNNKVYNGNDGGLYVSSDLGVSWQFISYGIRARLCYSVHTAKSEPSIVAPACQDNNAARKLGAVWQAFYGPVEGKDCVFDCKDPDIAYTTDYSIEGGLSVYDHVPRTGEFQWSSYALPMPIENKAFYPPVTSDPSLSKVVYLGLENVYKYVNLNPTPIKISNFGGGAAIEFIEVANSNSQYICTIKGTQIYRTTNGGTSWTLINTTSSLPIQVSVHPTNPDKIAIITNSNSTEKVLYSTNGGVSWIDYTANLSEIGRCVAFDSTTTDDLYVGCNRGVYVRNTINNAWSLVNTNLANSAVTDLDIHYKTRKIRVSTYGRGVWESPIPATLNYQPIVTITSPQTETIFAANSNIAITATASDPLGSVNRVEFYNGATLLFSDNTAPYAYTWNNVASGAYTIIAKVYDNSNSTNTNSVKVLVGSRIDLKNGIPAGTIQLVSSTTSDIGNVSNLYDNDPNSLVRSANINPYQATFNFPAGVKLNIFRIFTGGQDHNVSLEVASTLADLQNKSGSYQALVNNVAVPQVAWTNFSFLEVTTNYVRFSQQRTSGDNFVHVYEMELFGTVLTSNGLPPTVSIASPVNNQVFVVPASVNIQANASDPDGTISKVEFYVNGGLVNTDLTSPYSFVWSGATAGAYTLTAKAFDNSSNSTLSSPVSIVLNILPTVSITAPANNASINAGDITITAAAADANGTVSKVEFFRNGTKLGEDLSSPYSYLWTAVAAGSYTLTAVATDNNNGTTTSAVVNIVVVQGGQQPFTGTPIAIPGTVEAENYDLGGQGIAYNDLNTINNGGQYRTDGVDVEICTEGGHNVGWMDAGEWLEYTVNVSTSDSYKMDARITSGTSTGSMQLQLDGANISAVVPVQTTGGWQNWQTLTIPTMTLTAGVHVLALKVTGTGFNINKMVFTKLTNQAPTITITTPTNNASFIAPANITIAATASDVDGTISKVEFFNGSNTTPINTDVSAPYSFVWNGLTAGTYVITAKATDDGGAVGTSAAVTVVVTTSGQQPFSGTPIAIPGTVEAENYDLGGQGIAYNDLNTINNGGQYRTDGVDVEICTEGGHNVGWMDAGEWLEYTVNVSTSGSYKVDARITSGTSTGSMQLQLDGANISAVVPVQTTGGWQNWQTLTIPTMTLTAGVHVLALRVTGTGFNLNKMVFTKLTNQAPTINITTPTNNASFTAPANITIAATASDVDGTISKVEFFNGSNTTPINTDVTAPYSFAWNGLTAGTYVITAKATDDGGAVGTSAAVTVVVTTSGQQPFTGTPIVIPGTVEAENYDLGGQNIAYNDLAAGNNGGAYRSEAVDMQACSEGGFNVGWTEASEWLEYTVNVTQSGVYTMDTRVASNVSTGALQLEMDGVNITDVIVVNSTGGWQNWITLSRSGINLTLGAHILKAKIIGGDFNFNRMTFTRVSARLSDNDNREEKALIIYPNPMGENDMLYFVESDKNISVKVLNTTGNVVLEEKQWNTSTPLNLRALSKGVYQLVIEVNGEIRNTKVIR